MAWAIAAIVPCRITVGVCYYYKRAEANREPGNRTFWRVVRSKSASMYLIAPDITPTSRAAPSIVLAFPEEGGQRRTRAHRH